MSNINDFIIEDGVLKKYVGPGGEVTIPQGVTKINTNAFKGCTTLISVTIPTGVTNIGAGAFYKCTSLTSVTIPESVTLIGKESFMYCGSLTSVTIPKSVKKIRTDAFFCCSNLTSVSISEGVTEIGELAFSCCRKLTKITLPPTPGLVTLKNFDYSDALRIDIPNVSVLPAKFRINAALCFAEDGGLPTDPRFESHGKYLKANAGKLVQTAVGNPALLTLLCREKWIKAKDMEAYMTAVEQTGDAECIAMLLDYNANKLTTKEKEKVANKKEDREKIVFERAIARANRTGICGMNFAIAGRVKTFYDMKELEDFIEEKGGKLQSSVSAETDYLIMNDDTPVNSKKQTADELGIEIITEYQFNEKADRHFWIGDDGALLRYRGVGGDLVIPEFVTRISDFAFHDCVALTSVIIPSGLTEIGENAFSGCTNLISITIPDSVTKIGNSAFYKCSALTSITIPDSVTEIGSETFLGCTKLTCVIIPQSITEIEWSLFYGCTALTSVTIPDSVTKIGNLAFGKCISLASINIPDSVTELGHSVFYGCTTLACVTIPDNVTKIDASLFKDCTALKSAIIPASVTEIGTGVFSGCDNLTVYAPADSCAEKYAQKRKIPFVVEQIDK